MRRPPDVLEIANFDIGASVGEPKALDLLDVCLEELTDTAERSRHFVEVSRTSLDRDADSVSEDIVSYLSRK